MDPNKRDFLRFSSLALASMPFAALATDGAATAPEASRTAGAGRPSGATGDAQHGVPVDWLEPLTTQPLAGVSWGLPWPQGAVPAGTGFVVASDNGTEQPLQSWPLAYWPDGSLKWSGHALPPSRLSATALRIRPRKALTEAGQSLVSQGPNGLYIDTGILRARVPTQGQILLSEVTGPGQAAIREAVLKVEIDDALADEAAAPVLRHHYLSDIEAVEIEQNGSDRAVIKIQGRHTEPSGGQVLPFILRIYVYRGSASLRLVHSLVYDLDPERAFVRGIGLVLQLPQQAPLHDRHLRLVSAEGGVFAEAVRGITGLRRDPGASISRAQVAGAATPPLAAWPATVSTRIDDVPAFGDYSLLQGHADGYAIRKRTGPGAGWIAAAAGSRASGSGYLGSPQGGVAFGIRNFWQSHPGQINIRHANGDEAELALWLWAPRGEPMDLRAYRSSPDSYPAQREVLDITYEDPEPGFNTPYGIARSSEITLLLLPATPAAEQLVALDRQIQKPPQLTPSTAQIHASGVFSAYYAPAAPHSPLERDLDAGLAWCFEYYRRQVEQRRWYGFWDYGDVMHTYDAYRHVWRYDVGGFAWDNGELSTEIWLWHYYLYSGRSDVFRMAEAMTRHTSEVDVYHIGRFAPLGSRHDVQHWGDSAKQLRVSTTANHRFFYYLSTDERLGDLLREQVNGVDRLREIIPGRKIDPPVPAYDHSSHARVSFGTDWGAVAAAWLTEWERTGDNHWRERLLTSMQSIAAQPHGFFTGAGDMELATGRFERDTSGVIRVSHLSAVFGLTEIASELIRLIPSPEFRQAWIDYCVLFNADQATQQKALGQSLGKLNLSQGHARLLAYAGRQLADPQLQRRAWTQFLAGKAGITFADQHSQHISPPEVLQAVDEAPRVSTNAVAQWGLGAIGLLALASTEEPLV
ncbi:exo-rhamnogalacturonan lyase family protein [Frateuria aurantia]